MYSTCNRILLLLCYFHPAHAFQLPRLFFSGLGMDWAFIHVSVPNNISRRLCCKRNIALHGARVRCVCRQRLLFSHQGQDRSLPPARTLASEVRSFLGQKSEVFFLVEFNAGFLPHLSINAEPLRKVTHKGATLIWEAEQQDAFLELKQQLAQATALAYFNEDK